MKFEVKKEINDIERYINQGVFNQLNSFIRNLTTMKYNTDLEWFNCAIIAKESKDDEVIVKTKEQWAVYYESDRELEESGDNHPINLLFPYFDEREDMITFKLQKTYFRRAFIINHNYKFYVFSSIERVIKEYDYMKLRQQLKENWEIKFIEQYLKKFQFYHESSEVERNFYKKILLITYGAALDVVVPEENRNIKEISDLSIEPISLYKRIHSIITEFHLYVEYFLVHLKNKYNTIKQLEILREQEIPEGYELLNLLELGKEEDIDLFIERRNLGR